MPLYKHFGNNIYLEVQNHIENNQISINKKCLALKAAYGLGLIAANDSHYVDLEGNKMVGEPLVLYSDNNLSK